MSGGSYNYLFTKTAGEIHADSEDLVMMEDRLRRLDHRATRACEQTGRVRALLREAQEVMEDLTGVWYAVEWCDSSDWNEEKMLAVLDEYEEDSNN